MKKRLAFFTAMLLLVCSVVLAQDLNIQGLVRDRQGNPIPGATIRVKGTSKGATTKPDATYAIQAASTAVLEFSFIGYKTQEIAVGGRTQVNVTLEDGNTDLDEVVVVGYGTQKKKDLTTAVAAISTKDISERPIVIAAGALQGKAAGVQVSQPSGKPGSGFSVRVRGATSVLAGNDPLYVIDGVPTGDARDLNSNDIESIQVLKDASSAAIYGARAANGVVIITTKRGRANTSQINFSAYYGVSNLAKKINVLNADQYNALITEMGIPLVATKETTDWNKEVFRTSINQNYQLSFSGGTDKSQYFISGGITQDKGIVRPAGYNRYSFRSNTDNQLRSWLKVSTNLSYSNVQLKDVKDNASAGRNAVVLGALNAPPTIGKYMYDANGNKQFTQNPYKSGWDNPLGAIEGPTQGTIDNRILGNVAADVFLTKGLKFRSNFGADYFNHKYDYYLDYIMTTPGRLDHGTATSQKFNSLTTLWENTLNYDKSWKKHSLSALGGITTQQNKYNVSDINGRDFPADPTVKTLNAANQVTASTFESEWFLMSYIGRVMYNYDSKYLLTANLRYDGSSKLDKRHKWGAFPSVSAGWRISGEPFMKDIKAISDLKIRASWGQNGNQEGLDPYASYGLNTFNRRTPTSPLSGPAIVPPTIGPNPDLKWETTTQTNIGIDLSLFNSRLTFTADAYIKKTNDLILNVPLPNTAPYTSIPRNSGALQNKGLEFVISSINIDKKDFTWKTDFNMTFNRNKITRLDLNKIYRFAGIEGRDEVILLQEGVPLGTFFGYISEGVDPQTGNIKYKDVNGDGALTPEDRTIIGNAQPKFTYGLNSDLRYKDWSFAFLIQGSQGNDIFNASRIETEGMYDSKNQSTEVLRRWTTPGQNTDIPRASNGDINNSRVSSRFVENGSFLRLKSATIGYSLPKSLAEKIKLNRLSVYVTAQNLFTITKYKGFDPEINAYAADKNNGPALGIDYGTYPTARAFIFGVNMSF
ncbi:TonB-dependent receptor [Chitinophaga sp. MD30]|uniref:SusC/RagA family TonB-linked outer membrane protein n=1 Tax=Chitinophaga sp. MD30 TaxID=2033437 RepID=UPI000BB0CAD8|nr:TonB-dependent receptor [Chitinophaga sp. MD30]ASZ11261.1 SusC/RagA family TonB-linked outer membrane protein [Chitinophaga sp. MD30]